MRYVIDETLAGGRVAGYVIREVDPDGPLPPEPWQMFAWYPALRRLTWMGVRQVVVQFRNGSRRRLRLPALPEPV